MNSLSKLFNDTYVSSIIHDNDSQQVVITLLNRYSDSYCVYKIFYDVLSKRMKNIHIKDFTYNDFVNFFIQKAREEGLR